MKKIGIVGWKTGDNSFGITTSYAQFFNEFGNVKILNPVPPKDIDLDVDLLVLPGGPDISPSIYSQVPDYFVGKGCPHREYFDKYLLPIYIKNNTPIFGICRGHQTLGLLFGLELNQSISHEQNESDRTKLVHEVRLTTEGKEIHNPNPYNKSGNGNQKQSKFETNSLHHQGFYFEAQEDLDKKDIVILGVTPSPLSVIEVIKHKTKPIISVQWHPEEIYDAFSLKAIKLLLNTNHAE